jgi:hypothetical protein
MNPSNPIAALMLWFAAPVFAQTADEAAISKLLHTSSTGRRCR